MLKEEGNGAAEDTAANRNPRLSRMRWRGKPNSGTLASSPMAVRYTASQCDAGLFFCDVWPPLPEPIPRSSPDRSAPSPPSSSTTQTRLCALMVFLIGLGAFLMVAITNFNCSYLHRKGRLCLRPGQLHPYGTPLPMWLASLNPPRVPFASLRSQDTHGVAARTALAATSGRHNERLLEEELHRRLSRSWAEILAAANAEDTRVSAPAGDRSNEVVHHVPLYLRYLTAIHHDCDPAGTHYKAGVDPPRVRMVTVTNQVNPNLCSLQASAALAGIPLVTLGLEEKYSAPGRYETILTFIEREGLRDEDVLVYIDSDVTFTGEDVAPFLEKFIRLSPATEAELEPSLTRAWEDYGEVLAPLFAERELNRSHHYGQGHDGVCRSTTARRGRSLLQLPPIIYNTERYCFTGDLLEDEGQCIFAYALSDAAVARARNREEDYSIEPRHTDTIPSWWAQHVTFQESPASTDAARSSSRPAARDSSTPLHFLPNISLFSILDEQNRFAAPTTARAATTSSGSPATGGPASQKRSSARSATPRPSHEDPFFYHKNDYARLNNARYLNSGGSVARVWAFKRLVAALREFTTTHQRHVWAAERLAAAEDPVGYAAAIATGSRQEVVKFAAERARLREGALVWRSDQSVVSAFYLYGRIWEADHGVLTTDAGGAPPAVVPQYGLPVGLQGLDRRSEFFFVTTDAIPEVDYTAAEGYHEKICGAAGGCHRYPARTSRAGATLTQPLFHVFPTQEDVVRRVYTVQAGGRKGNWAVPPSRDPDVAAAFSAWGRRFNILPSLRSTHETPTVFHVRPVLFHYAGGWKDLRYTTHRKSFPWFAATRSGNTTVARQHRAILDKAVVEGWGADDVLLLPFTPLCGYPFPLH